MLRNKLQKMFILILFSQNFASMTWFNTNDHSVLHFRHKNLFKILEIAFQDDKQQSFITQYPQEALLDDFDKEFIKNSKYSVHDVFEYHKLYYKIRKYLSERCKKQKSKPNLKIYEFCHHLMGFKKMDICIIVNNDLLVFSNKNIVVINKYKTQKSISIDTSACTFLWPYVDNSGEKDAEYFDFEGFDINFIPEVFLLNPYEYKTQNKIYTEKPCKDECGFVDCTFLNQKGLLERYTDKQPPCITFRNEILDNILSIDSNCIECFSDCKIEDKMELYFKLDRLKYKIHQYFFLLRQGFIYKDIQYFLNFVTSFLSEIFLIFDSKDIENIFQDLSLIEVKNMYHNVVARINVAFFLVNCRMWSHHFKNFDLLRKYRLNDRIFSYLCDNGDFKNLNKMIEVYDFPENFYISIYLAKHFLNSSQKVLNQSLKALKIIESAQKKNLFDGIQERNIDENFYDLIYRRYPKLIDFAVLSQLENLIHDFQDEYNAITKLKYPIIIMKNWILTEYNIYRDDATSLKLFLYAKEDMNRCTFDIFLPYHNVSKIFTFVKIKLTIQRTDMNSGFMIYGHDLYEIENGNHKLKSSKYLQKYFVLDDNNVNFYADFVSEFDNKKIMTIFG